MSKLKKAQREKAKQLRKDATWDDSVAFVGRTKPIRDAARKRAKTRRFMADRLDK